MKHDSIKTFVSKTVHTIVLKEQHLKHTKMIKELKDVFPTKTSLAVFIGYMGLFVNQGLLVTASRLGGDVYPYNPIAVVLVTELVKLFLAFLIYLRT